MCILKITTWSLRSTPSGYLWTTDEKHLKLLETFERVSVKDIQLRAQEHYFPLQPQRSISSSNGKMTDEWMVLCRKFEKQTKLQP